MKMCRSQRNKSEKVTLNSREGEQTEQNDKIRPEGPFNDVETFKTNSKRIALATPPLSSIPPP